MKRKTKIKKKNKKQPIWPETFIFGLLLNGSLFIMKLIVDWKLQWKRFNKRWIRFTWLLLSFAFGTDFPDFLSHLFIASRRFSITFFNFVGQVFQRIMDINFLSAENIIKECSYHVFLSSRNQKHIY